MKLFVNDGAVIYCIFIRHSKFENYVVQTCNSYQIYMISTKYLTLTHVDTIVFSEEQSLLSWIMAGL